jgi:hypothetical protein
MADHVQLQATFINHLTPWIRKLLQKVIRKLRVFYGKQRLIRVFKRARHWSLFWARWIQSQTPKSFSPNFNLILSFHLCLGFPTYLLPSGFTTKILYAFLISPCVLYVPLISSSLMRWLLILGEDYKHPQHADFPSLHAVSLHPLRSKVTFAQAATHFRLMMP